MSTDHGTEGTGGPEAEAGSQAAAAAAKDALLTFGEVLELETAAINQRRKAVFGDEHKVAGEPPAGCTVGLALSGGGIRSATFNLGVLQVLGRMKFWHEHKKAEGGEQQEKKPGRRSLLDRVDYLSTVSGGGYIGSWLAAGYLRCGREPDADDQPSPPFLGETSKEIHHLRAFSRYLSPQAGIMSPDAWTMVSIWLRNTLLMQLTIACCVFFVLLVKRFGAELFCWLAEQNEHHRAWWWIVTGVGFISTVFGLALAGRELKRYQKKMPGSGWNQGRVVALVATPLLIAAWCFGFSLWTCYYRGVLDRPTHEVCWILRDAKRLPGAATLTVLAFVFGLAGACLSFCAMVDVSKMRRCALTVLALIGGLAVNFVMLYALDTGMKKLGNEARCWVPPLPARSSQGKVTRPTDGDVAVIQRMKGGPVKSLTVEPVKGETPADAEATRKNDAILAEVHQNILRCHLGLLILLGCVLQVSIMVGLIGRDMRDDVREWLSRLGAWLWILLVSWLGLHLLALMAPRVVFGLPPFDQYGEFLRSEGVTAGAFVTWLLTTVASSLAARSGETGGGKNKVPLWKELLARLGPFVALGGMLVLGSVGTHLIMKSKDPLFASLDPLTWVLLGAFLFLAWVLLRRVDLNEFSMNHFYRNRLVRCYLGGSRVEASGENQRHPHPFTGFDFDDDLPLARLTGDEEFADKPYLGPYPIINAALNSSKGGDLATQERHAESFVFTPRHVGASFDPGRSEEMIAPPGYRNTRIYANAERAEPLTAKTDRQSGNQENHGLTLGTCMSISGAAVSPNWGFHTSPVTAFLLTVVNARLGWWLPNPWRDHWRKAEPGGRFGFKWLRCLLAELGGSVSAEGEFIYTSDGGHFENLGIYELVRRRCGLIVVSDAEQDGDYGFYGLGTAIRRCRVDFDTEINLDLSKIRNIRDDLKDGVYRESHCAVGQIIYPADEKNKLPRSEGVIVYLKLSVTGDEPEDIRQYRTLVPEFPHESTADQFFNESQFESYRRLGEHVAKESLEMLWNDAGANGRSPENMTSFSEDLLEYWPPDGKYWETEEPAAAPDAQSKT